MIVNLHKIRHNFFLNIIKNLKAALLYNSSLKLSERLVHDSKQLKVFFQNRYPTLKKDFQNSVVCTSCKLCEESCPTNAIEVKSSNSFDFPGKLKQGEAPQHFYLSLNDCIKCGLCKDVCIVDALEMNGEFSVSKVDLL